MNSASPYASVIIPAYNVAPYIAQAIQSALSQTWTNIEVIVIDDASTDATWIILQKIQDPRLRVFRNEINSGPGATRNKAMQKARGVWLVFLDGDDYMDTRRIETLCAYAEEHNLDMVADDHHMILESGAKKSLFRYLGIRQTNTLVTGSYHARYTPAIHPIVRAEFLQRNIIEFGEIVRPCEDFWMWMRMYAHGAKVFFYKDAFYFYRIRENSLTRDAFAVLVSMKTACEQLIQEKCIVADPDIMRAITAKQKEYTEKLYITQTLAKGSTIQKFLTLPYALYWLSVKYIRIYF